MIQTAERRTTSTSLAIGRTRIPEDLIGIKDGPDSLNNIKRTLKNCCDLENWVNYTGLTAHLADIALNPLNIHGNSLDFFSSQSFRLVNTTEASKKILREKLDKIMESFGQELFVKTFEISDSLSTASKEAFAGIYVAHLITLKSLFPGELKSWIARGKAETPSTRFAVFIYQEYQRMLQNRDKTGLFDTRVVEQEVLTRLRTSPISMEFSPTL